MSTPASETFSEELVRRGTKTDDDDDDGTPVLFRFCVATPQAPLRTDRVAHRLVPPPPPLVLPPYIPDPPQEVTVTTGTVNAR